MYEEFVSTRKFHSFIICVSIISKFVFYRHKELRYDYRYYDLTEVLSIMQQLEILQKRNLLIYVTFLFSNVVFFTVIFLKIFQYSFYNLIYCISTFLILTAMYYLKTNPKIFQISLIVCWHIHILLVNLQSSNFITLYIFIYIIAILGLYQSVIINIVNSIFSVLQIIFLLHFSTIPFKTLDGHDNNIFILFFILVCVISLLQTYYVKYIWKNVENVMLEREYELTSKEGYLQLFFEHAEDAIAVFDLEDRVITVNPAFEKLYGWTKEESIGKVLPLVPPTNNEGANVRRVSIREGQSYTLIETQDMKKDGTIFDAQISLSPIYNPHGELIATSVISRDISYIKQTENLIVQSEKMKLVGELAAGVAHEIRNPMTVISGFVQMMNEDPSSPYYEYTKLIQNETERIDLILSEFLVLSRPQATQFALFNLVDTIVEITQLFQFEFQQKAITLKIVNPYKKTMIMGNENQIKQVFINLIKNSIEAIGRNGKIHIELCKSDDEKSISITIKDTGCGIPPHVLEKIFEPFYTTKTKGTGLGMMIINKVIQDHKGKIHITSKENIGTKIVLCLPIEQN